MFVAAQTGDWMNTAKASKSQRPTKKERICNAIARNKCGVKIKETLRAIPSDIAVATNLITSRVPGRQGTIAGFDPGLYGVYWNIKVDGKLGIYHIDDFII